MHPGQKLKPGAVVEFPGPVALHAEVIDRRFYGRRVIRLWTGDGSPVADAVDAIGHMPLPPYIKRADRAADRERYQTVFAQDRGSVAAPTAGSALHRRPARRACASAACRPPRLRCTSATAPFNRCGCSGSRSTGSSRNGSRSTSCGGRGDERGPVRAPPRHRRRHDDDADAGGGRTGARRRDRRRQAERPICSSTPVSISGSSAG